MSSHSIQFNSHSVRHLSLFFVFRKVCFVFFFTRALPEVKAISAIVIVFCNQKIYIKIVIFWPLHPYLILTNDNKINYMLYVEMRLQQMGKIVGNVSRLNLHNFSISPSLTSKPFLRLLSVLQSFHVNITLITLFCSVIFTKNKNLICSHFHTIQYLNK